ncbi:MAG: CBS domain-containing protein [Anaerolineae bacterium]|nr:CBS domain-containing protein [Anaerolineae bacterium]
MASINQLLQNKGGQVWSVSPDNTVLEALTTMAEKNIGAVVVVEPDGTVCGIFSERDYARKVVLNGRSSKSTLVREVMTGEVYYVRPQDSVDRCMTLMSEKRFRHLPVLNDDSELVGMISIGDVVKTIIAEQKLLINHLEDFITGTR